MTAEGVGDLVIPQGCEQVVPRVAHGVDVSWGSR